VETVVPLELEEKNHPIHTFTKHKNHIHSYHIGSTKTIPIQIFIFLIPQYKLTVSSAIDRSFEPRSDQTKDYKIGICCFSTKHAALRRKSKVWLARNQANNLTEILLTVALSNNKTDIDNLTELLLKVAVHNNKTDIDDLNEILCKVTLNNNKTNIDNLMKYC
jgi:hypothetical protein